MSTSVDPARQITASTATLARSTFPVSLTDYPKGARYAAGVDEQNQFVWKPVDQAYVDRLNSAWERLTGRSSPDEASPKRARSKSKPTP